ncbi:hypothetical protein OAT16_06405 [Prolixibacteraceae bacterium]|nr:hypothetical protein [Prolixibacteraceae bacterium]
MSTRDGTQMKQIGQMNTDFIGVEAHGVGHGFNGLDGFPRIFYCG